MLTIGVDGRNWPLKGGHILILGPCEYGALHGRRDFAICDWVKDLEMGRISWVISGP